MGMYYNVICEEIEITGGKVIHIDKNLGNMNDVINLSVKISANIQTPNGNFIL